MHKLFPVILCILPIVFYCQCDIMVSVKGSGTQGESTGITQMGEKSPLEKIKKFFKKVLTFTYNVV